MFICTSRGQKNNSWYVIEPEKLNEYLMVIFSITAHQSVTHHMRIVTWLATCDTHHQARERKAGLMKRRLSLNLQHAHSCHCVTSRVRNALLQNNAFVTWATQWHAISGNVLTQLYYCHMSQALPQKDTRDVQSYVTRSATARLAQLSEHRHQSTTWQTSQDCCHTKSATHDMSTVPWLLPHL